MCVSVERAIRGIRTALAWLVGAMFLMIFVHHLIYYSVGNVYIR